MAPSEEMSFFEVDIYTMEQEEVSDIIHITQRQLLFPLCQLLSNTESAVLAEIALTSFHTVLTSCGHRLEGDVWNDIIFVLSSLSGFRDSHAIRNSRAWEGCCIKAFSSLKLIVDDFLEKVPSTSTFRIALLDCCASFGFSKHDANVSFTATGLLWTLADQDPSPPLIEVRTPIYLLRSNIDIVANSCGNKFSSILIQSC